MRLRTSVVLLGVLVSLVASTAVAQADAVSRDTLVHKGLRHFAFDCVESRGDGVQLDSEAVRNRISSALVGAGLIPRTEKLAAADPSTLLSTAFLCFSLHSKKLGEGSMVSYALELRQFALLVRHVASGNKEPIKVGTATYTFLNYYTSDDVQQVLLHEVGETARHVADRIVRADKEK